MGVMHFANNALARLSAALGAGDTTIQLESGQGELFPSITGSDFFHATLESKTTRAVEIVKVTARTANELTVVRAQDGTTALEFEEGDFVEARLTRGALQRLVQVDPTLVENDKVLVRRGGEWGVQDAPDDATLGGLLDVNLSGLVDGDTLVWDAGAGEWRRMVSGDESAYLPRDGSRTLTADWNVGNKKITGLAAPTVDSGAATKLYVDTADGVLAALIAGKADAVHLHAIADVTGLQTALDGKSATGHGHAISDVTGLQTALDGKSATGHGHAIADVTGLQTALDNKLSTSLKGAANGLAELDAGGKVPAAQLPAIAITDTFVVASEAAMLALVAETGDVAVRTDLSQTFILKGADPSVLADWEELQVPGLVASVNGQTGTVTLGAGDIAFAPAGDIAATTVQAAVEELDSEKLALTGGVVTGQTTFQTAASYGVVAVFEGTNGAAGPITRSRHPSATPAAFDDLWLHQVLGNSSTGVERTLLEIIAQYVDPTNTSEDARWGFSTTIAGAKALRLWLGAGLYAEGLTDPGAQRINMADYYLSGSTIFATASEYRTGTATNKLLPVDQAWAAMAEVTLTDAEPTAWDMSLGIDFVWTPTGARTLSNPTNVTVGKRGRLRILGSGTVTWSSNYEFAGGVAPTLTTGDDCLYYDVISSTRILIMFGAGNHS
jgi:hypothetical protein